MNRIWFLYSSDALLNTQLLIWLPAFGSAFNHLGSAEDKLQEKLIKACVTLFSKADEFIEHWTEGTVGDIKDT